MVEVNKLVSLQKTVNHDAALELVKEVKDESDLMGAVKVSLSTSIPSTKIMISKDADGYIIASTNLNLDMLGVRVGEIELPETKERMRCAQMLFGARTSYVRVVHYQGRCILRDGYTRVYGLMSKGFIRVPCIFVEATDSTQVGFASNAPHLFPREVVMSSNPPLIHDFMEIADSIDMPITGKVIKVRLEEM